MQVCVFITNICPAPFRNILLRSDVFSLIEELFNISGITLPLWGKKSNKCFVLSRSCVFMF